MSGITGIFRRDGKDVDPSDIKKMNDKIAHRGPDGSKVWCEGPVAFGHQMLHTTPESLHEILPFEDEESGLVITADARIDNREDLAPKLGIEDNEHVSDSYFILKAYEKWGDKCPEELLGDFAFAIWDKNRETLFCARDHMGVKPFYYYMNENKFLFATEIKVFFTILKNDPTINELKIALYLKNVRTNNVLTFYNNVYRLSAANSITIGCKNKSGRNYWKLDPDSSILLDTDEEYFKTFREIFSLAIRCRLRSAFPIGYDLSGGLDSSSIVCVAKEILNANNSNLKKINTFSQIYDDFPESDERYYIQKVIATGGIESNLIKCDKISPLDEIDTILEFQDQPFHRPFLSILWNMYKEMQKNKIRVHFSGNGGDVIISHGDQYFVELFASLKWKTLIEELTFFSNNNNTNSLTEFLSKVVFPLIPQQFKRLFSFVWFYLQKCFFSHEITIGNPKHLINQKFGEKTNINNYSNEAIWNPKKKSNASKVAHYNSIFAIPEQESFEIMDITSAAFSIEPRFPYYDKRLIEFCYSIPSNLKFRKGWDRYIQRMSMDKILPPTVQWRSGKAHLIPFLIKNLILFEKNRLNKMIEKHGHIERYVNLDVLNNIYREYQKNHNIEYVHVYQLWKVIILDSWFRKIKKSKKNHLQ